jgi:hypothetical protein
MSIGKELDGVELSMLEEYFVNGNSNQMPEELVNWLDLMQQMHGRMKRWDGTRKNHLDFFMAPPFELTKPQAERLFSDTLEFFHVEKNDSLEAYANYYAEKLESLANASVKILSSDRDLKTAGDLLQKAMDMRAKYRPEEPAFPEEILQQRHIIFQDNKRLLGEKMESRTELAALVDSWEISQEQKERLRSEAGIDQPKLKLDESTRLLSKS